MRYVRRRGYAMVMAMLLLVLGGVLCAWLFQSVTTSVVMVKNDVHGARAMMAAESGLDYALMKLDQVAGDPANPITAGDETEALATLIGRLAPAWNVAGHALSQSSDPAAPAAWVSGVPVGTNSAFAMDLRSSTHAGADYVLRITGTHGGASREIGLYLSAQGGVMPGWMRWPMISRGSMSPKGGAGIERWDGVQDALTGDMGVPSELSDDQGYALVFANTPDISKVTFPTRYLPTGKDASGNTIDVYEKLDAMKAAGQLPTFVPEVSKPGKKGTPATVGSLNSTYIPPNTTIAFADSVTLTGIIYVGWPNKLTFGKNVTINGVIIYEKPPTSQVPAVDESSPSVIDVRTTVNLKTSQNTSAMVVDELLRLGGTASITEAQAYADLVWPWTVAAPDTDWNCSEGNTTGTIDFIGSMHIHNFAKAAGSGGASTDQHRYHGTIVCEGGVDIRGNRGFAIEPPDPNDPNNRRGGITVAMVKGGYWEK